LAKVSVVISTWRLRFIGLLKIDAGTLLPSIKYYFRFFISNIANSPV
jgi:hypothetical protein